MDIEQVETPPQAWGRRSKHTRRAVIAGNTPTGVGKTFTPEVKLPETKKHPHRRGEDFFFLGNNISFLETPPQAWGRLHIQVI